MGPSICIYFKFLTLLLIGVPPFYMILGWQNTRPQKTKTKKKEKKIFLKPITRINSWRYLLLNKYLIIVLFMGPLQVNMNRLSLIRIIVRTVLDNYTMRKSFILLFEIISLLVTFYTSTHGYTLHLLGQSALENLPW